MSDKKISELDAITGANTAADDYFVVVDTSGQVTKKISRAELNNAIEQDVLSTVDINGGTIDNTVIGGTTPAAGDFTTINSTGIDVTGTVVADGLTVDNNTVSFNGTADQNLNLYTSNVGADNRINFGDANDADVGRIYYQHNGNHMLFYTNAGKRLKLHGNGDISFYDNTGVTQGFYWDADQQSLGLGTTTPSSYGELAVYKASGNVEAAIVTGGANYATYRLQNNARRYSMQIRTDQSNAFVIRDETASANRFSVDTSGNVGIGTSSASSALHISSNTYPQLEIDDKASRNYAMGVTASTFRIRDVTGAADRLTIDSSGSLLVGATAEADWETVAGFRTRQSGSTTITRSAAPVLYVNRLTSNGDLVEFRKDGSAVGSIGVDADSTNLMIGNGVVGLRFVEGSNHIRPANIDTGGNRDNAIDLGYGSSRFKDLYLSGGVYLGGTAAANALDDYEEGTWTANINFGSNTGSSTGATYIQSTGNYVKIGNLVHVQCRVTLTNKGSSTGNANITGIPFSSNAGGSLPIVPLSCWYSIFTGVTRGQVIIGRIDNNSAGIELRFLDGNNEAVLNDTHLTNSSTVAISGTYYTTS